MATKNKKTATLAEVEICDDSQISNAGNLVSNSGDILRDVAYMAELEQCKATIIKSYRIVVHATDYWLRMGFALIQAKRLIKHGYFMKWRAKEFPAFKNSHLSNAMRSCDWIISQKGITAADLVTEDEWHDFTESVIGEYRDLSQRDLLGHATQKPALMLGIAAHNDRYNDIRPCDSSWKEGDPLETYGQAVERIFAAHPEQQDELLPLLESGEITYAEAYQRLAGKYVKEVKAEKGEDWLRKAGSGIRTSVRKLAFWQEHANWAEITQDDLRHEVQETLASFLASMPASMRQYVIMKAQTQNDTP